MEGSSGFLECEERECGPEEVMIEDVCFDIDDTSRCQGYGMLKYCTATCLKRICKQYILSTNYLIPTCAKESLCS